MGLALGLLAACSERPEANPAAKFGCGAIDGLGAISATYIIFGEVIETNEAPAAFAELACQLAARQPKDKPLWVGMPDYIGGTTEAVRAMRKRVEELRAKGAPIVLGEALKGHTLGTSRREETESEWAGAIMASMNKAGAGRALLLVPRSFGVVERVIAEDRRLEDYTPMALFLPEGQVLNLEIGQANGVGAPTIRIYLKMRKGYVGQIAFERVTPAFKSEPASVPVKAPEKAPAPVKE
jgi:hypothetical protein